MILGTLVNTGAIVVGSALGLGIAYLSKKSKKASESAISNSITKVVGLTVFILGIDMALTEHDFLAIVIALVLGTLIGELCKIEDFLAQIGDTLKKAINSKSDTFVTGFVYSAVLYCAGALAIIGAIKDGLMGDSSVLLVKAALDGITSIILTSVMGIGVMFAAVPVLLYQGAISIGASKLTFLLENDIYMNGISAVGGVMVVAIGFNVISNGKFQFKVANMLPALPLIVIYDFLYITYWL